MLITSRSGQLPTSWMQLWLWHHSPAGLINLQLCHIDNGNQDSEASVILKAWCRLKHATDDYLSTASTKPNAKCKRHNICSNQTFSNLLWRPHNAYHVCSYIKKKNHRRVVDLAKAGSSLLKSFFLARIQAFFIKSWASFLTRQWEIKLFSPAFELSAEPYERGSITFPAFRRV